MIWVVVFEEPEENKTWLAEDGSMFGLQPFSVAIWDIIISARTVAFTSPQTAYIR